MCDLAFPVSNHFQPSQRIPIWYTRPAIGEHDVLSPRLLHPHPHYVPFAPMLVRQHPQLYLAMHMLLLALRRLYGSIFAAVIGYDDFPRPMLLRQKHLGFH
jgi:hypothetical protein